MTERKLALVTGGSRGIGLSCALELAKNGCDIIVNDICDAAYINGKCCIYFERNT